MQALPLLALAPSRAILVAGIGIVSINAGAWAWERRRAPDGLLTGRLTSLFATLGLFATCSAPWLGLEFRSDLAEWADRLAVYFAPSALLRTASWHELGVWFVGALLSMSEANLVLRLLIERLSLRPPPAGSPNPSGLIEAREYARGRVIGLLERLIVFTLVFQGEYGALGFVIATKGLARFKSLEDREFAEYFLIGTMMSIVLSGGIALVARQLLPGH